MALATDAPKQSFRLGMLIYDTRYRAITIQVIVLVLVLLFVGWLLDNARQNLAARGKDIDFSFLWRRAGYDIQQTLIPYSNDSTHFRAVLVGLLNTLVVAFFGCIFATIIGVFFGVLRLSKNWLISRMMGIYIEVFRNIPVLLWIVLVYVVFADTMPEPKAFRPNAEGVAEKSMWLWDSMVVTNRGTNIPAPLLTHPLPALDTAALSLNTSLWFIVALVGVSIWLNRKIVQNATKVQQATGVRPTTWWKSVIVLIVPTVVALMAMGLHFEYPALKGFNFQGGINVAHAFSALLIGLTLYYAAVIAETVRAGVQAISRGQSEAAFALGLQPGRTMSLVILPQALRVIIPPLISQFLSLTKDTSLGIAVSYLDLRGTLGGITLNQTGRELECMILLMLIYLLISLIISAVMNAYNASVKLKER